MESKSISSLSLKEIMELKSEDLKTLNQKAIIREKKLQFMSAHAETVKRLDKHENNLQDSLLNVEKFDVNTIIAATIAIENEKKVLEVLTERFTILFPDQKLDVLGD